MRDLRINNHNHDATVPSIRIRGGVGTVRPPTRFVLLTANESLCVESYQLMLISHPPYDMWKWVCLLVYNISILKVAVRTLSRS